MPLIAYTDKRFSQKRLDLIDHVNPGPWAERVEEEEHDRRTLRLISRNFSAVEDVIDGMEEDDD